MKMFILRQVVLLSCFCVAGAEAKRTVILEIHTTERDYQPAQLYVEQHLRTVEPGGVVRIDVEDSASMVHVRTVDGKVAVMFPVNGAVPLPAAEGARAQILVGRSPDEVLKDELAKYQATVAALAAKLPQAESLSNAVMAAASEVATRMGWKPEDIDRRVEQFDQAKLLAVQTAQQLIDKYVIALKNYGDACRALTLEKKASTKSIMSLRVYAEEYNRAFDNFYYNRGSVMGGLRATAGDVAGDRAVEGFRKIAALTLDSLHKDEIVTKADEFLILQKRAYGTEKVADKDVQNAMAVMNQVGRTIRDAAAVIDVAVLDFRDACEAVVRVKKQEEQ
jgi:hypothetical protein